ncbi:hypothetical protein BB560_000842 [Smittium megazygosporum]|uniref:Uncharacterized protein n=1 Tax=Smittium megazygosporum TaxID=133381 RepID=A0A2T9ZJ66_9FUNG|nr:hypothetical protein BB560_000842 [Smittium megazygosporum]
MDGSFSDPNIHDARNKNREYFNPSPRQSISELSFGARIPETERHRIASNTNNPENAFLADEKDQKLTNDATNDSSLKANELYYSVPHSTFSKTIASLNYLVQLLEKHIVQNGLNSLPVNNSSVGKSQNLENKKLSETTNLNKTMHKDLLSVSRILNELPRSVYAEINSNLDNNRVSNMVKGGTKGFASYSRYEDDYVPGFNQKSEGAKTRTSNKTHMNKYSSTNIASPTWILESINSERDIVIGQQQSFEKDDENSNSGSLPDSNPNSKQEIISTPQQDPSADLIALHQLNNKKALSIYKNTNINIQAALSVAPLPRFTNFDYDY